MQDTFKRIVTKDISEDAAKLKQSTCLIYGANDDATPPEIGRELSKIIPHANLKVLPETGHFVHQEQVYSVANSVKEFAL